MAREFKYKSVRKALEKELLNSLQIGDYLPTLPELCRRFAVSSITMTRVLRELAAAGRLERIKHCGTRICAPQQTNTSSNKRQLKILATQPIQWLFIRIMEKKLLEFCRKEPNLELRCEYASRAEQIERIYYNDYDFIFADSIQIKLMLHNHTLRSRLKPLADLPGLQIDPADFVPAGIRLGSDPQKELYALPLTCGPALQMINRSENISVQIPELSNFYDAWFLQLTKLQRSGQALMIMPLDYRYLEGIFRSYGSPLFNEDMQHINLDSRPVKEILKMLEYYLHNQQLGLLIADQRRVLDEIKKDVLKRTPLPLHIASMINLKPGCGCQSFRIKTLPQARQATSWLFWEGVAVGKNCDPALAVSVLNYLQSASVQSLLPGCTALPARLDMQKLALAAYEPEFPGLTAAYNTALSYADNPHPVPYAALNELNRYLRTVICGVEPVNLHCKNVARRINAILRNARKANLTS